jgi:hypothetical protein
MLRQQSLSIRVSLYPHSHQFAWLLDEQILCHLPPTASKMNMMNHCHGLFPGFSRKHIRMPITCTHLSSRTFSTHVNSDPKWLSLYMKTYKSFMDDVSHYLTLTWYSRMDSFKVEWVTHCDAVWKGQHFTYFFNGERNLQWTSSANHSHTTDSAM